jgi:hypothetical protein
MPDPTISLSIRAQKIVRLAKGIAIDGRAKTRYYRLKFI